jgi:hypothetical protein
MAFPPVAALNRRSPPQGPGPSFIRDFRPRTAAEGFYTARTASQPPFPVLQDVRIRS